MVLNASEAGAYEDLMQAERWRSRAHRNAGVASRRGRLSTVRFEDQGGVASRHTLMRDPFMARSMHHLAAEDRMKTMKNRAPRTGADVDAALAAAAQGLAPTSDDADALGDGEDRRETDVIGKAAGVAVADGKELGGPDEIDARDAHRWELDPASADELGAADQTLGKSPAANARRPSSGER